MIFSIIECLIIVIISMDFHTCSEHSETPWFYYHNRPKPYFKSKSDSRESISYGVACFAKQIVFL